MFLHTKKGLHPILTVFWFYFGSTLINVGRQKVRFVLCAISGILLLVLVASLLQFSLILWRIIGGFCVVFKQKYSELLVFREFICR